MLADHELYRHLSYHRAWSSYMNHAFMSLTAYTYTILYTFYRARRRGRGSLFESPTDRNCWIVNSKLIS